MAWTASLWLYPHGRRCGTPGPRWRWGPGMSLPVLPTGHRIWHGRPTGHRIWHGRPVFGCIHTAAAAVLQDQDGDGGPGCHFPYCQRAIEYGMDGQRAIEYGMDGQSLVVSTRPPLRYSRT